MTRFAITALLLITVCFNVFAQKSRKGQPITVIAYYFGPPEQVDSFAVEKLTHIIFSFCHLKGNVLVVDNARDSLIIQKLVSLKRRNPQLKVLLSLGGWGGCETCSQVFSDEKDREVFAQSVKNLLDYFQADGIDLDWEYPAISGYPGHRFVPEDKPNFTQLVKQLRKTIGKTQEISFAAGGFSTFLEQAVEWKKVMQVCDRVNLMTYDLINGFSTVTGHHTPLYSTPQQKESTDYAIRYLDSIGIPRNKLVIGAAFYARIFENVDSVNNGLYQPGKFKRGVPFKAFPTMLSQDSGFVAHWDPVASAPWMYNAAQKLFVTYDDPRSMRLKTAYAKYKKLNGIMFWQLGEDTFSGGLLDAIYNEKVK
ncbi:glycoside hydrolase [Niastella yeongjuensis]|uniref:chitinase n=1 Tax=Niastella yeongjuensis TaxID=354355 RepID=A0A1V9EAI5_9BACT|nr:glycoside hydrolase family 18 protein [Niastella yeongjuensis]OQP43138.1 glycoside hydrolase [Niastella yeongjuensis]SEO67914.1 chitinase [Niastella yeongjuensis]